MLGMGHRVGSRPCLGLALPCQVGSDGGGCLGGLVRLGAWAGVPEGGSDPVRCTGVVEPPQLEERYAKLLTWLFQVILSLRGVEGTR